MLCKSNYVKLDWRKKYNLKFCFLYVRGFTMKCTVSIH